MFPASFVCEGQITMGDRFNPISEWIRKYCADHHLTLAQFARIADISSAVVARWMSGKRIPTRSLIRELAAQLRLNAEERAELWRTVGLAGDDAEQIAPIEQDELPSLEQLRQLPRWALVAYAVRCAQRVFPLFERWDEQKKYSGDVATAIRVATGLTKHGSLNDAAAYSDVAAKLCAEADARSDANARAAAAAAAVAGATAADSDTVTVVAPLIAAAAAFAASASVNAARVARADAADTEVAREIAKSINAAAEATHDALFIRAARRDFGALLTMTKCVQWRPGYGFDPQSIPNLWIDGAPDWYYESELLKDILPANDVESVPVPTGGTFPVSISLPLYSPKVNISFDYVFGEASALELYFERGKSSKESFQRVLEALTKLHIAHGGSGLKFQPDDGFIHVRELVEA